MSNLIVMPSEVDGWDVIREEDPQALTNTATKETAVEAAETFLADEGGEGEVVVREESAHGVDDTGVGASRRTSSRSWDSSPPSS